MDYSNAKIYKILNYIDDDVYIGATCQPLSKRMSRHRRRRNVECKKHNKLYRKMVELGVEHFYIELVVECPVENAEQLRAIEGQYIREMGTLNIRIEGRTKQQYREDNKETKREYSKNYWLENRDRLMEKNQEFMVNNPDYYKQYYENNKHRMLEINKKQRELNPDKFREYQQEYREQNKDKIKQTNKKLRSKQRPKTRKISLEY